MNAVKWGAALFLLSGLVPAAAQSYHGVTCDDVRRLSPAEQAYWSQRLNLTAEQKHRIYIACYQNYNRRHRQDVGPIADIMR